MRNTKGYLSDVERVKLKNNGLAGMRVILDYLDFLSEHIDRLYDRNEQLSYELNEYRSGSKKPKKLKTPNGVSSRLDRNTVS